MAATAAFAFSWAIARAAVQSITIDEADTYLAWVARPDPSHWQAASNNHVLNSLLMRLSTSVFGVSHLSVRAPALLGAAIYILAAWALARLLSPLVRVQWPILAGLVFNPFVFDHLVAARGYALALGFLTAAIALAAYGRESQWPPARWCAACSVCLALSVAANLSFAIVDAILMAAIAAWACARTQAIQARVRIAGASVLPGLLVSVFVSAPVVLHWSQREMVYGSRSLREWFGEVVRDSLFELNPQIVNPLLMKLLRLLDPWLIPAMLGLAVCEWARRRGHRIAYVLLGVAAAAVAVHWAGFRLFHVLMPKERTAIWIVPLIMVAVGAVASERRVLLGAMYALSFYFLLCLRLTYFREWYWDAEVKQAYDVIAYYNHAYGVTGVGSYWMYGASLNFYRLASGRESLDEIHASIPTSRGHKLYVLNWAYEEPLAREEGLRVVFRGRQSEIVVAIRPEIEARGPAPLLCTTPAPAQ